MSEIFLSKAQRSPKEQMLDYDKITAKKLVEDSIKQDAYDFALGINLDWKEEDILREAKKLAIKIAALKKFDETFEELISQIEGAR